MNRRQLGGVAAVVEAATYVVGLVLLVAVLMPAGYGDGGAAGSVAFLADHQALVFVWNLIIYLVAGVALVVLVLALGERLETGSPALVRTATAFGLIWAGLIIASGMIANIGLEAVVDLAGEDQARAATVWSALDAVQEGLGGGNELVGGVWVLLLSCAALRTGQLSRGLNRLGATIGVAGILTLVPPLEVLTAVFGLGFIAWYAWVGILLLRGDPGVAPGLDGSGEPAAALPLRGAA